MKKLLFSFLLLLTATTALWAQAPQRISYQSIIRDGSNVVMASSPVGIKISLLQGTAAGSAVYIETHSKTTNANGLLSLEIGDGTAISGTFAGIDWSNGPYLIKTETDPTGGTNYSIPGIAALNSVPYALFSANGTPGPQGELGATGPAGANGTNGIAGATGPQGLRGETGPAGAIGPQGIQGVTGAAGANGTNGAAGTNGSNGLDGKTVLNGTVDPTNLGVIGDFYINTATSTLFGPKASGGWPTGVSFAGAAGIQGIQGAAGADGTNGATGATGTNGSNGLDGKTVLNGTVDPTNQGVNGDLYINTATNTLFGPKASGAWLTTGTSLVGPTGATGIQGFQGIQGVAGTPGTNGLYGLAGLNGTNGTNGLDGKTVLNGTVNPTSQGVNGDFYINTTSNTIFGPKASNAWPSGVSLVGGGAGTSGTWAIVISSSGGLSLISSSGFYSRVGDIVSFSAFLSFSGNTNYGIATFEMDLPIVSNFSNTNDANGSVSGGNNSFLEPIGGFINANGTSKKLKISLYPMDWGYSNLRSPSIGISGMYIVK